jgi:hypothetical protein
MVFVATYKLHVLESIMQAVHGTEMPVQAHNNYIFKECTTDGKFNVVKLECFLEWMRDEELYGCGKQYNIEAENLQNIMLSLEEVGFGLPTMIAMSAVAEADHFKYITEMLDVPWMPEHERTVDAVKSGVIVDYMSFLEFDLKASNLKSDASIQTRSVTRLA